LPQPVSDLSRTVALTQLHYDGCVASTSTILSTIRQWWNEQSAQYGPVKTLQRLLANIWEFLRDSTPSSRKQRYGDIEYDWDNRVDTTSATISWHTRLLGLFHSPYQPTEPALFAEMLEYLKLDFCEFIFIDIGSGKGRALLMAAEFPFRRVIGVELLTELHRIAQENIKHLSESRKCRAVESVCADARGFIFPVEPTVLYLFNPLPEAGLHQFVENLEKSLRANPRSIFLLYHNPLLEHVLAQSPVLKKVHGTNQFSIYSET
jgi:SAM-dependent methyltransferase